MKQVTKERILKALEHSSRYFNNKPEVHIVYTLAKVGLNLAIGNAIGNNPDPFTDRDRLELAYQGFNDPEQIFKRLSRFSSDQNLDSVTAIKEAWLSSFDRTIHRQWQRDRRIIEIQQRHRVSGLEKVEVDLGDRKRLFHVPDEMLALLDSDFQVMHSERMAIAREFVRATRRHGMTLYEHVDKDDRWEWIEVKRNRVLFCAFNHIWVKTWMHKKYINYQEIQDHGYTTPKPSPETAADEMSLEFHLVVRGNDRVDSNFRRDLEDESEVAWFCGRLGRGKPSL